MLRDETGRFKKGNSGFWKGKKRPTISGARNFKWAGDKNDRTCDQCEKKFRRPRSSTGIPRFCSMKCYGASKRGKFFGKNNPRWRGGITPINEAIRHSEEYRTWREKVYRKDRWTCQICRRHLKQLIAHHIKVFEKFPKLRFEPTNEITLCRACHCKIHAENRNTTDFTKILRDYTPGSPKAT